MTDLDSPKKNNDCYFYYYSTCAKGDNCTFRHEPSALGCETMCSFWKEGKCLNVHCNFRHMELRKNRKAIQCYWESQPGGCLKPHCPFLHQAPKPASAELESKSVSESELSQKSFKNTAVDSLVVNFEEESDNESAPANSPAKPNQLKVKTLEEIKLEKIQAESAAYYSYPDTQPANAPEADDLRQRILDRISSKKPEAPKRRSSTDQPGNPAKKLKADVNEIKILTLEEIRAERAKKSKENSQNNNSNGLQVPENKCTDEEQPEKPKKRIKLQRKLVSDQEETAEKTEDESMDMTDVSKDSEENASEKDERPSEENSSDVNKTIDEVLLLQDDDDATNVSLKDEERLLNDDLDDLLRD